MYVLATNEIVGFEVIPCSVKQDPEAIAKLKMNDHITPPSCPWGLDGAQAIRVDERVTFTYEVEFVRSDITWPSRWEVYLENEQARVHWFSILNSLLTIFIFAGVLFKFSRTSMENFNRIRAAQSDKERQLLMNDGLLGLNLVHGEAFTEPSCSKLLCVMVGNGVQIAGMAIATILCSALGLMSSDSRGMLLTGMIILYHLFAIVGGYVGVWLWKSIKGTSEGWRPVSWFVWCFFFGLAFAIFTLSNIVHWRSGSTGAVSIVLYFTLLGMWVCISLPLTFLGGFLAAKSGEPTEVPVKTNQNFIQNPLRNLFSWLLVVVAGALPFGTIFIELFFILSSIYFGRFYYVFGFLLIVVLFLCIVCAEVSVGLTYRCLGGEEWNWWWKAFFASGSSGFYVFWYSVNYLVFDLRGLNGPTSVGLYLGYSMIIAVAIMLSTGAVGFLVAFCFIRFLSSLGKFQN